MNQELSDALDAAVERQTFSLTAVKAVSELRAENKALRDREAARERLTADEAARATVALKIQEAVRPFETKVADLAKRETALMVAEAVVAVRKEMADRALALVELLFKNRTIRESVYGSVPLAMPAGSYPQSGSVSRDVTRTEE